MPPARTRAGFSLVEMALTFALVAVIAALAVPSLQAVLEDNADNAARAELANLHNDVAALAAAEGLYALEYHRRHVVAMSPGGLRSAPAGTVEQLTVIDGLEDGSPGHGWVSFGTDSTSVRAALAMRTGRGRCTYLVSEHGEVVSLYVTDDATCRADRARLSGGDGILAGTTQATWPGE